ncbi:MAG: helix-turn-helix domain-containing protein [Sporomusaceae bacterium]|jgi:transcriptional regulator with XRE-family HTH domain|nr:helix-turn-helix domain-containing protein [Sporomusaceae bacterium]
MYDKNSLEGFSIRLRQCLKEQNLKQVEVAKRAAISKHTITKYLNGKREPRPKSASKLAGALGVDAAWLLYGSTKTAAVAKESVVTGIPADLSFDRMHDILDELEFTARQDPLVRQEAAKIFKQAFEELYVKINEKAEKYSR